MSIQHRNLRRRRPLVNDSSIATTKQQRQQTTQPSADSRRRKYKERSTNFNSTRMERIWDLLRHIPGFLRRFLRLMAFVVCLLPAFAVFVWHYLTCDRIAVYYGDIYDTTTDDESEEYGLLAEPRDRHRGPFFSRHYLDIYGSATATDSSSSGEKKPVVIFLTGGAWIIGYRMWGCLLARALVPFGVLCVMPDYRNFPRVPVEGMVNDVDRSVQWVFDHIEEFGGDRDNVVLVGQSAGAHLGGVVVATKVLDWLREKMKCRNSDGSDSDNSQGCNSRCGRLKSTYSPQQLRGFISTSAPNNLVTMRPIFHHHGLSSSMQMAIFGGSGNYANTHEGEREDDVFEKWSPYHLMLKCREEYLNLLEHNDGSSDDLPQLKDIFPNYCVVHGTADQTVPISEAEAFIELLSRLRVPYEERLYEGWSHTDLILEAPMRGDHTYHRDVFELTRLWAVKGSPGNVGMAEQGSPACEPQVAFDEGHHMLRPICPALLVEFARYCNPF